MTQLIARDVIAQSGVQFGTSGARGLVTQFSSDVCAAFVHAFISSLKTSFSFTQVAVAIDNRPSSPAMAQAVVKALQNSGIEAIYYGVVPTPALAFKAIQDGIPSIMVTGSHIPFDRNGIKFYRPDGEISKLDEQAITSSDVEFESIDSLPELAPSMEAAACYVNRYVSLFDSSLLSGKRIGIYEHSSAGRDLYKGIFEALGAEVLSLERSDEFVPIDTEAVSEADQQKARSWSKLYNLDFIFSTDGDGDRPLVSDENGQWLRGDILGLLCAQEMKMEALAIPVSCNSVIFQSPAFDQVVKTRIGSPYVIEAFDELKKNYHAYAGFEANGGFLLGSDVEVNGRLLKRLPTRDAVLPALMVMSAAKNRTLSGLVEALPQRFTHSDRVQNFPTANSCQLLQEGRANTGELLNRIDLSQHHVVSVDNTDGLRMTLDEASIVHLRPSGNAPELRCYVESDCAARSKRLVEQVLGAVAQLEFEQVEFV